MLCTNSTRMEARSRDKESDSSAVETAKAHTKIQRHGDSLKIAVRCAWTPTLKTHGVSKPKFTRAKSCASPFWFAAWPLRLRGLSRSLRSGALA